MAENEKEVNEETAEAEEAKEAEAQAEGETEETAEPETEETEAAEAEEETEGETEGEAEEEAAGSSEEEKQEEAPKKKERKLNWTKRGQSDEEEAAQADEIAAKINEANEKYARLFAEFDNFRKRSEKEKSQMFDMGARNVIEKILPIMDSLERGLAQVPEEHREDPFVAGMDKVYKQFEKTLTDMGVEPIEALGKEFDPNFHNAVMHVDDEEAGENVIVEEFQKGYTYKGTVVRFSMVKVAN